MSKKLIELREKRAKLIADARALNEKATTEKRGLTAEEDSNWNKMMNDADELRKQIDAEQRLIDAEREIAESEQRSGKTTPADDKGKGPVNRRATPEYQEAFTAFLCGAATPDQKRALQSDIDTSGSFIVAPQQFVATLIKSIDDEVFMRGLATKFQVTSSDSMGAPSLDADPADADWTAEILTGNEDSTMAFGKRELRPHPLAKRIKISNKLLRIAAMSPEALVQARLSYKFAVSQEKGFLTGSGSNQPLGVFTASANGVSAARDVSTDNTTTAITMDGLLNAKYSLKGGYLKNAQWLFHRDAVKMIAKLKDTTNQYIWEPSKKVGDPDMLLGRPVNQSEYVPNTFTTGLYVGMLADFSYYWIADALDMQIQRLNELYAETNQTGYIGRLETDGMPVLAEAFARVKLA